MSSDTRTCPFCNARFPVVAPPAERVVCPRCGEPLPGQNVNGVQAAAPAPPPSAERPSKKRVVGVLALVMTTMAAVGLAFALWTVKDRRKRDPREPTKVEVTAPAGLAMLGYLPSDTDVVLGLHVAELLEQPRGRDLLERVRLPVGDIGIHSVQQQLGIRVEDIDHLVVGLRTAAGGGIPRTTILVQTRKPVDTKKVLEARKAGSRKKQGAKSYRPSSLPVTGGISLDAALWLTDDDYRLILQAPENTLSALPDEPNPSSDHLAPPLRQFLRERTRGTQLWVVGDIEDWKQTLLEGAMHWEIVPEAAGKLIMNVRGFGFWAGLGDGVQVGGHVDGRDEAGAAAVAALLKLGWRAERLFGDAPELRPLTRELDQNLRMDLKDVRFTIQTKASAEALRQVFAPPEPKE